jgi:hypothetical protein
MCQSEFHTTFEKKDDWNASHEMKITRYIDISCLEGIQNTNNSLGADTIVPLLVRQDNFYARSAAKRATTLDLLDTIVST